MKLFSDYSELWNLGDYARTKVSEYKAKGLVSLPCSPLTKFQPLSTDVLEIRRRMFNNEDIMFANINFQRKLHSNENLPKVVLHSYASRNKVPMPVYETRREDRLYYSVATFEGKKYATLVWDRHRKHAEQAAALVCLQYMNLVDDDILACCTYKRIK